jgi:hypothetical protein
MYRRPSWRRLGYGPVFRCPVHGAYPRSGIRPGVYAGLANPLNPLHVSAPFTGLQWLKPIGRLSPVNGAEYIAWRTSLTRHECRAYDRCAGCPVNGAIRRGTQLLLASWSRPTHWMRRLRPDPGAPGPPDDGTTNSFRTDDIRHGDLLSCTCCMTGRWQT